MNVSYIGLAAEILLFAGGVYTYLFSRGAIATKDSEARRRAEEFRQENAGWMRIFGLLLAAVMLVNIVLHLLEIFG